MFGVDEKSEKYKEVILIFFTDYFQSQFTDNVSRPMHLHCSARNECTLWMGCLLDFPNKNIGQRSILGEGFSNQVLSLTGTN